MKRIVTVLLAAFAAAGATLLFPDLTLQRVSAQSDLFVERVLRGEPVSAAINADDSDVAMVVKYVGSSASGKVAVAAGGDITFTDGAEGSEAATSTFECPVSGALGGIIDVSDAACDTLGEVVNVINASSNWRAVLIDGLASESSNDSLFTISATAATAENGLALAFDTDTVLFRVGAALVPSDARGIAAYLSSSNPGAGFKGNIFAGKRTALLYANATSTYASGTSSLEVYSVAGRFSQDSRRAYSETATLLWSEAGGATTANKVFTFPSFGVHAKKDEKLLVRLKNSAASASVRLIAYGHHYSFGL